MIEYDDNLLKYMQKTVREFNAKITALKRQGYRYLPPKESVEEIKDIYYEQDALLRKLHQLERFKSSDADIVVQTAGGARTTAWQIQTLREDVEELKRAKSAELSYVGSIVPTVAGKPQGFTYAEMGDATVLNLQQEIKAISKDYTKMNQSDLNRFMKYIRVKVIMANRQTKIFYDNYHEIIDIVAEKASLDPDVVQQVKDVLDQMKPYEFYEFYKTEKTFSQILEDYDLVKMDTSGFSDKKKTDIADYFKNLPQLMKDYKDLGAEGYKSKYAEQATEDEIHG